MGAIKDIKTIREKSRGISPERDDVQHKRSVTIQESNAPDKSIGGLEESKRTDPSPAVLPKQNNFVTKSHETG